MNHCVKYFNAVTGDYIETIGTEGKKGTDNSSFNGPSSLAIIPPEHFSGKECRLYVAENFGRRVQIYDIFSKSHLQTITLPKPSPSGFEMNCWGIAVQPPTTIDKEGAIFIADYKKSEVGGGIMVFSAKSCDYRGYLVSGTNGTGTTAVSACVDCGGKTKVCVSNTKNSRIEIYDADSLIVAAGLKYDTSNTRK
jgi:hypothetical protein